MSVRFQTSQGRLTTRLHFCVKQLLDLVETLPEDVELNVVSYASRAQVAFDSLKPANEEHKAELNRWCGRLRASGGTNAWDALCAAFRFKDEGLEAVYLLR